MSSILLTTGEKSLIGVTPMDRGKPPAPVSNGSVTFESSNTAVASIEPIADDPYHAWLLSPGPGTAVVTAKGGGSLAGFPSETLEVTVNNTEGGALNFTAGAPEEE